MIYRIYVDQNRYFFIFKSLKTVFCIFLNLMIMLTVFNIFFPFIKIKLIKLLITINFIFIYIIIYIFGELNIPKKSSNCSRMNIGIFIKRIITKKLKEKRIYIRRY
jgi:hypothetical protein